jgi:hypothetical protein
VPGSFGQFASQRFGGDDIVALGQLSSMPALGPFIITANEVCRFDESPPQVAIAALAVVVSFLLSVTGLCCRHRAAVAGKILRAREARDVCGFKYDRHGQDFSDAGNAQQLAVMGPFSGHLEHMILHAQNAAAEGIDVSFLDIGSELFGRILELGN